MAIKKDRNYFEEELGVLNGRLNYYIRYGYSPSLEPLVKILAKAVDELTKEYKRVISESANNS